MGQKMRKDRAGAVLSVSGCSHSSIHIHTWEPPGVEKTARRPDGVISGCEALETGVLPQIARHPVGFSRNATQSRVFSPRCKGSIYQIQAEFGGWGSVS